MLINLSGSGQNPKNSIVCIVSNQAIPGNDQNASPTNQKTAGSKLDRTSLLMFYGSWRQLESFFRWLFGANMFAGMSSQILGEKFGI